MDVVCVSSHCLLILHEFLVFKLNFSIVGPIPTGSCSSSACANVCVAPQTKRQTRSRRDSFLSVALTACVLFLAELWASMK